MSDEIKWVTYITKNRLLGDTGVYVLDGGAF